MADLTRFCGCILVIVLGVTSLLRGGGPIIIDHEDRDLTAYRPSDFQLAKSTLHIAYGHTSHGSQLITGMNAMVGFINGGGLGLSYPTDFFEWNEGGYNDALDIDDYFMAGDLGNPDRDTWAARTRTYLNSAANADVNVVMWSWCGQADTTAANIDLYLSLMSQLEIDYPHVTFVYMTGHVNGCSTTGNLFYRNQQIRDYCNANDKVLYDFADIESYDPDGLYVGDKLVTDACWYDSDGNGTRDRNWAADYAAGHTLGVHWYNCSPAHTHAVNGNMKAYAAWALFAEIAEARTSFDLEDFAKMAATWDAAPGDPQYDNAWDLVDNDLVDLADLAVFSSYWLRNR